MTNSQKKAYERVKKDLLYATPNENGEYTLIESLPNDGKYGFTVFLTRRFKECSLTDDTIYVKIGKKGKIWYFEQGYEKCWKPYKSLIWTAICAYKGK